MERLLERTDILDMMGSLKLFGMRSAFDEIVTTAVKRQHEPQRLVGDLLKAEIDEKLARSIKYQMTIARAVPQRAESQPGLAAAVLILLRWSARECRHGSRLITRPAPPRDRGDRGRCLLS